MVACHTSIGSVFDVAVGEAGFRFFDVGVGGGEDFFFVRDIGANLSTRTLVPV